jgi:hypothetical protein
MSKIYLSLLPYFKEVTSRGIPLCDNTRTSRAGKNKKSKTTHPKISVSIAVAPRVSCPLLKRQKVKRKTRKDRRPDKSIMYVFIKLNLSSGLGFGM